ncbi:MAG TPA: phospholipase D-like domain-containing protein [Longimicrobiaceae bacterium]|nr:phospholipase D-like domain-containing protein [Longimicrobiaceae bacterium]
MGDRHLAPADAADADERVRALLRRCCLGHCAQGSGHACDQPPTVIFPPVSAPGDLPRDGPLGDRVQEELRAICGAAPTADNTVRILVDGVQAYGAMLDLIEGASHELLLENYIIRADQVGLGFVDELARQAARGVSVWVLLDPLGSRLSTLPLARRLRGSAVRVRLYNPPRFAAAFFRGWRDHRKLVVQDRTRVFAGGMCIADIWAGNCVRRCTWRDSAVVAQGSAATRAADAFDTAWRTQGPAGELASGPSAAGTGRGQGSVPVRVVADGGGARRVERALAAVFRAARSEILITSSYFVPTPPLVAALTGAARRGVITRVLIPRRSDHRVIDLAAEHLLGCLLRAGVRVWLWNGPMLHAKSVVVDRCWTLVGSSNLDAFSLWRNAELNLEIHGTAVGEQAARLFAADLEGSRELTLEAWTRRPRWRRLATRMAAALWRWQ